MNPVKHVGDPDFGFASVSLLTPCPLCPSWLYSARKALAGRYDSGTRRAGSARRQGVSYHVQGSEEFEMAAIAGGQAWGHAHVLQDDEPAFGLFVHAENNALREVVKSFFGAPWRPIVSMVSNCAPSSG